MKSLKWSLLLFWKALLHSNWIPTLHVCIMWTDCLLAEACRSQYLVVQLYQLFFIVASFVQLSLIQLPGLPQFFSELPRLLLQSLLVASPRALSTPNTPRFHNKHSRAQISLLHLSNSLSNSSKFPQMVQSFQNIMKKPWCALTWKTVLQLE